jgi:hypothetical protein
MTKVTTGATMSLDGYIANASHGGFEYLFQWYDLAGRKQSSGQTSCSSCSAPPHAATTCWLLRLSPVSGPE